MPTSKDRHDQATTLIHEMTHLSSVFSPNTVDYVFNPENVKNLEPQKALLNGETYNLYARGEFCAPSLPSRNLPTGMGHVLLTDLGSCMEK